MPTACGALAFAAGVLVIAGWLTRTAMLLRLSDQFVAVVFGTGVCLALGGLALTLRRKTGARAHRLSAWLGAGLLWVSSLMLLELLLGRDLGIDLPSWHAWLQDGNPQPGRMAPATALGFWLLGLGLSSEWVRTSSRAFWHLRLGCGIGVLLLSAIGLLSQFVHTELLFGWAGQFNRMAPYTALSMLVLAAGYIGRWTSAAELDDSPQAHRRRIFNAAAMALSVVALITGLAGFALQLNSVTQKAHEHLSRALGDRRLVLQEALATAHANALVATGSPWLRHGALNLLPSRQALAAIAAQLLPQGFSYVAFEGENGTWASAGRSMGTPAREVRLQGEAPGSLAWREGYFFRHRQAVIEGPPGVALYLVTEQPLKVLALLSNEIGQWGVSFDMALCADGGPPWLTCFPQRLMPHAFTAGKMMKGQPLPMALAVSGHTGVTARLDFRQRQVVAAYAPVGDTGLGMVLKVDSDELYAPARRQFLIVLPVIVLIVAAGLWVLRIRLRPMVQALVSTREMAQANEARFIAAMESSLDAFYILRAERDAHGEIVDFRFTYATARGAALVSLTPSQVEGQLLCELLPINRSQGFFDKYKAVVDTGVALA